MKKNNRKKAQFVLVGVLFALGVLSLIILSQGCQNSIPTSVSNVVPTPLPTNVISNFNNGTLLMNPSLWNGNGGNFVPETYGGVAGHPNQIDGSNNPNILIPNPGDGSAYAVHVYGPQTDPLPTTYPAMEVFAFLKNDPANPYYDMTFGGTNPFTGIRMDVKILPYSVAGGVTTGDNNPQKRFAVGVAQEVPPTTAPGGLCPPNFSNNCYNYFWGALPTTSAGVSNGWAPVTFTFASLVMDSGYGTNVPGGTHLNASGGIYEQKALFLLWKFGDNGAGSATNTDFWFDNVQFY